MKNRSFLVLFHLVALSAWGQVNSARSPLVIQGSTMSCPSCLTSAGVTGVDSIYADSPLVASAPVGAVTLSISGPVDSAVFADSSRVSGLSDSAKALAQYARTTAVHDTSLAIRASIVYPLDSARARSIVHDTSLVIRAGNVATATTLQTPRTLTIGSTGKAFNGSANVSWSLAEIGAAPAFSSGAGNRFWATPNGSSGVPSLRAIVAGDIPSLAYLPLSGGTLTGALSGTSASFSGSVTVGSLSGIVRASGGLLSASALSSSDVTSALGYTPLSNATAYLPLAGGTLTGALSGTSAVFNGSLSSTILGGTTASWGNYNPVWIKIGTVSITAQYGSASGRCRFLTSGNSGQTTPAGTHGGSVFFRIKQQNPMTSGLDVCTLIWESSTDMGSTQFFAIKTADNSTVKTVDFYLQIGESYEFLNYIWEASSGLTVQNTVYTSSPGTPTYYGIGSINLDAASATVNVNNALSGTSATFSSLSGGGIVRAAPGTGLLSASALSSSDVTSALGYTPLSNATAFLPLAAGSGSPLTGGLYGTSASFSGTVTADQFHATNNGNGTNFQVGDDLYIGDANISQGMQLMGVSDHTKAYVKFGNAGPTIGYAGSGSLGVSGGLSITGSLSGTSATFSGLLTANGDVQVGGNITLANPTSTSGGGGYTQPFVTSNSVQYYDGGGLFTLQAPSASGLAGKTFRICARGATIAGFPIGANTYYTSPGPALAAGQCIEMYSDGAKWSYR